MARVKQKRAAFTLIELLVVIAIIGILVALLLPAIQKVREAADKVVCANNLKQVGLALQTYHDSNDVFPPGYTEAQTTTQTGTSASQDPDCSWTWANWAILILPYIEQGNLARQYNFKKSNQDPANKFVREFLVQTYVCPADGSGDFTPIVPESGPASSGSGPGGIGPGLPGPGPVPDIGDVQCGSPTGNTQSDIPYMPGSYRGVSGRYNRGNPFDNPNNAPYDHVEWRGVLHVAGDPSGLQPEKITNITDGTSNTLMVGEAQTSTHPRRRTFWAYAYTSYALSAGTAPGDNKAAAATLFNDYDLCAQNTQKTGPCKRGWGSFHPGGINFVFCDGSVHMLKATIDMDVFAGLTSITGGEENNNWED